MKRAIVIGSPGAGKSTFARQLRDRTGLPLHYLDMIWHLPDRTTITKDEFDEKLTEFLKTESWIIPWVEEELDEEFRQFIMDFPKTELPQIYQLFEQYGEEKEMHIFRTRDDAEQYLENLETFYDQTDEGK